jgi:hypothetical protein
MQSNKKNPKSQVRNKSKDLFYVRVAFYQWLEAGGRDLSAAAGELGVSVETLKKWKRGFDPDGVNTSVRSHLPILRIESQDLTQQGCAVDYGESTERRHASFRQGGPEACHPQETDRNPPEDGRSVCPPQIDTRQDILEAMRRQALDGSVPAAKLLLTEYQSEPADKQEVLTVERAVELLREWGKEKDEG